MGLARDVKFNAREGTKINATDPDCIYIVSNELHDLGRVVEVVLIER